MNNAQDFTQHLHDLLRDEHGALADFLVALAEFDERRLWVDLGYASLFDFLHRELCLSKSAAFYRKTAVALIREFPEVTRALRDGKLCLMTVAEVARVLTGENRAEVLPRFFGLSKREAKVLVATLLPVEAPPLREVVTPLRVASPAPALTLTVPPSPLSQQVNAPVLPVELPGPCRPPSRPGAPSRTCRRSGGDSRRAPHRGPEPAARDRVPTVPREARGRPRRPLALPSRCERGRDPRGRPRPRPRAAREAEGRREAAPPRAAALLRIRTTSPRT